MRDPSVHDLANQFLMRETRFLIRLNTPSVIRDFPPPQSEVFFYLLCEDVRGFIKNEFHIKKESRRMNGMAHGVTLQSFFRRKRFTRSAANASLIRNENS